MVNHTFNATPPERLQQNQLQNQSRTGKEQLSATNLLSTHFSVVTLRLQASQNLNAVIVTVLDHNVKNCIGQCDISRCYLTDTDVGHLLNRNNYISERCLENYSLHLISFLGTLTTKYLVIFTPSLQNFACLPGTLGRSFCFVIKWPRHVTLYLGPIHIARLQKNEKLTSNVK